MSDQPRLAVKYSRRPIAQRIDRGNPVIPASKTVEVVFPRPSIWAIGRLAPSYTAVPIAPNGFSVLIQLPAAS